MTEVSTKSSWESLGRTAARRLFLDRQAAFWREELWDRRARVVEILDDTPDVKTFVLDPGRGWRGHRAGQHALVEVEIEGVRARRCYSISSAPGGPLVAITVKRQPGGRVSNWLHQRLRVGDRVELGAAQGDFVLPPTPPERLLFVSGGSGITPIASMLRDLAERRAFGDVVLAHYARSREDVIFDEELHTLAERHPRLRLFFGLSPMPAFDEATLAAAVPDFAARETYLCGPPGLMARVERMWEAAGATARLHRERFVLAPPAAAPVYGRVTVSLARAERSVQIDTAAPLLGQLEQAGLRPAHGCRMGICNSCRCHKRSGVVENLLDGTRSGEGEEEIRLCISAPRSDLELAL